MTVKRLLTMLLMAAMLISATGCMGKKNKDDLSLEEGSVSDAYGCIASEFIKFDRKPIFISQNYLSADSASKIRVLYDESEFKQVITGQTVNCDGTSIAYNMDCRDVGTVGYDFSCANIVLVSEGGESERKPRVEKLTDSGELTAKIELDTDYSVSSLDSAICIDKEGYIHISNMEKEDGNSILRSYCVFDSTGKMCKELTSAELGDTTGEKSLFELGMLPDGRIFADCISPKGEDNARHKLSVYDTKSGKCEDIFEYDTKLSDGSDMIVALNIFDDSRIVYLTKQGVFLSDYSFNNSKCIFDWKKNGVEFIPGNSEIGAYKICADHDGNVSVLLDKGYTSEYMKLAEIPKDTITVEIAGIGGVNQYGRAVIEYNKKHLDSRIVVKTDYDTTSLLTRIIAGDGPVIIEDGVINVRDQSDIWEPLENLVSQETIDKLNKGALICASINDKLYGAPTGFSVDTLVTGEDITDWNYDDFIGLLNSNDKFQTITCNSLLSGKQAVIESIFCNGCYDTFFVDTTDNNNYVDGEKLKTVIKLIDKYQSTDSFDRNSFEMVADGSMLCARFSVSRPLDYYGIMYAFGDKGNIIGYPGKTGSKHYIAGTGTLFARSNMTSKEKEIVSEFFELLLSYDGQMQIYEYNSGTGLSAREDVLDAQIDDLKEYEGERGALGGVWFTYENIEPTEVKEKLNELLEKGVPFPSRNDAFYEIVAGELNDYYNGKTDTDTLVDHLNKKIGLYIKERE